SDCCQAAKTLLQLRVNDRLRALESTLGALNLLLGDRAARTERAELRQAGRHNLSQVRLLRAVGDLDRLVQTAFLQSPCNARSKLTRLLARRRKVQRAIDHHGQRPDRHDEQNENDSLGEVTHVAP